MEDAQIDYDFKFEQHYAEVLAFVKKMKHASCFEIMKEFRVPYADSVHLMDTLEERDIVDVATEAKGPRPLLTEATRKLKKERQQREREEAKREATKPKHEPKPEAKRAEPAPVVAEPVPQVRTRARRKGVRG